MALRLTPDNLADFKGDDRFAGRYYVVVSAGPTQINPLNFGTLDAELNRKTDAVGIPDRDRKTIAAPNGVTDTRFIQSILKAYENFESGKFDYDALPQEGDDAYNSNSFISGLLKSLGVALPRGLRHVPGAEKPVPASEFRNSTGDIPSGTPGYKIFDVNGREVDQNVQCTGSRVERKSC